MCPHGLNKTAAFLSEHTTHSSIYSRKKICLIQLSHKRRICMCILCWDDWCSLDMFCLNTEWMLTLVLDWTCSLQRRHFFTLGEHREHVQTWPHGPNKVSRFKSEQTMHSSSASCSVCELTDTGEAGGWMPLHYITKELINYLTTARKIWALTISVLCYT